MKRANLSRTENSLRYFGLLSILLSGFVAVAVSTPAQAQDPIVCDVVAASPSIPAALSELLTAKGYKIYVDGKDLPLFLTLSFETLPMPAGMPAGRHEVTQKVRLTADPDNYFSRIADGRGTATFKTYTGLFGGLLLGRPISPSEDANYPAKLQKATTKATADALDEFDRQLPECKVN